MIVVSCDNHTKLFSTFPTNYTMWALVGIPRATHHNHTYSVCGCGHVFVGTEGGMRGTVGEVRGAGICDVKWLLVTAL